jgi:anthranilate synthase component 2
MSKDLTLILDNHDSFVYNIAHYVEELGSKVLVVRSDYLNLSDIESIRPDRIILSPGPGNPAMPSGARYLGVSIELVKKLSGKIPILGVCLGHQIIAHVFKAKITRAKRILHGKISLIIHNKHELFTNIPSPFKGTRYHSLTIDPKSLPNDLVVTAWTMEEGEVMALSHIKYPVFGVQFHPESIATEHGKQLLKNFLDMV